MLRIAAGFRAIDSIPSTSYKKIMKILIDVDLDGFIAFIIGTLAMLYVSVAAIVLLIAALDMADGARYEGSTIVILSCMAALIVPAVRYIVRVERYGS